jgi:hypothetical protein
MGIIDDYFDGYYSEEMIESQVFYTFFFSEFLCFCSPRMSYSNEVEETS